jgi:hypothetical protein
LETMSINSDISIGFSVYLLAMVRELRV